MLFIVIFGPISPKSCLNPDPDLEISEISSTLWSCISELNEDFLKIPKDFESSRLDLSEKRDIEGVFVFWSLLRDVYPPTQIAKCMLSPPP